MFRLLKYSKGKAKFLMILSISFIFIQSLFDIIQPIMLTCIMSFTDDTINDINILNIWKIPATDQVFWLLIGLMGVFAIMSLLFGVIGTYAGSKSSLLIAKNIREGMFAKVQTLSFIDIDKVTSSGLVTRITNDVQKFQITLQMINTMLIKAPFLLIGGLIISFTTNYIIGLIMLATIIILCVCISLVAKKGIPYFDKVQTGIDETNKVMRENVLGMRVVKTFCLEKVQQERYNKCSSEVKNNNTKAQIMFALMMPVISLTFQMTIAIILLTCGITMDGNGPQVFGMVQVLFLVLSAVIIGLMVIINASRSRPSRIRINQILSMEPSIKDVDNPKKLDEKNLLIEFKDVNFKYELDAEEYVLKNINLQIKPGEFVGIVGGTGSGKTTLISLISRLYDIHEGVVTISGVDIKETSTQDLRKNIGVVIQENILFSGTIKSNLLYGDQNATEKDLDEACEIACAKEFISSLSAKYNSPVEQRGRNFSGGQRQRLSISRTLVKKPNILILDDSTSALDMATEAKLQGNLKAKMADCTKIIVAQRISAVKDCDKIIVLENGEIVGLGDHDKLRKTNKQYRSIVLSQLGEEGLK